MTAATRYIALLRGINVGGNKKIKMADLREMFNARGFASVKTALASGNVAYDSDTDNLDAMRASIEAGIAETFGFSVNTLVFPQTRVERLVESDPFAEIVVTEDTRLNVSFLPNPVAAPFDTPHFVEAGGLTILSVSDTEVCSMLTISKIRTVDAMKFLDDTFGKGITTRTWKTVLKLSTL